MIALDHLSLRDAPPGLARSGHRVMLDRCYLEVGHEGDPLLFLRPDGPGGAARLREAAEALGREVTEFAGRDGEWLDVALAGPVALTRRVTPPEVAHNWPPPRNGAPRIEEVRIRGDAADLLDPLEALGGPPPELVVDHAPGEPLKVICVALTGGVRVL